MHLITRNLHGNGFRWRWWRPAALAALAFVLFAPMSALLADSAQNQRNSKDKKQQQEVTGIQSLITLPDAQAIDLMVSQMLGAWQIGDMDMLKTFYADDVLVVSGMWEPPLKGWANYARAYQAQRARTQAVRLDRRNTFIKTQGETAWCTYQWDFTAQVDGNASSAAGHTSLVLQKRADRWLIVLNHTSTAITPQAQPQQAAPAAAPAAAPRS
jgi:uncharacterized protein (TIGR02246 family)